MSFQIVITSLKPTALDSLFQNVDLKSLGRLNQVCQLFKQLTDSESLWKMQAAKIYPTLLPNPSFWRTWLKEGKISLEHGSIDLPKRTIQMYAFGAKLVQPMLEYIPGKITCKMVLGMGFVTGWYRDESNTIITTNLQECGARSDSSDAAEKLRAQMKQADNKHFTAFCVPKS